MIYAIIIVVCVVSAVGYLGWWLAISSITPQQVRSKLRSKRIKARHKRAITRHQDKIKKLRT